MDLEFWIGEKDCSIYTTKLSIRSSIQSAALYQTEFSANGRRAGPQDIASPPLQLANHRRVHPPAKRDFQKKLDQIRQSRIEEFNAIWLSPYPPIRMKALSIGGSLQRLGIL